MFNNFFTRFTLIWTFVCCGFFCITSTHENREFPPKNYNLILNENFSDLNLNKRLWNKTLSVFGQWDHNYHNDSYANCIMPDEVLLDNGTLRLRSRKRQIMNYEYSSGIVTTKDKFCFKYGYIEIRAKFPSGSGVWPAFWLMQQNNFWPSEFDIAEYYGASDMMHMGLCYGSFPDIRWSSDANNDTDFSGKFNTYGLYWTPEKVHWIQNGQIKRTITSNIPSEHMYIILSNGVGSPRGPAGTPTEYTVFPNYLEVDYVKVWIKN